MNFDLSDEQKMLRDQARKFLSDTASLVQVRDYLENDQSHDPALWQQMAELGWIGTVVPEQYGGAGLGYVELCVIAEELGRSLAPVPFASTVYLAGEAILTTGSEAQKSRLLPALAAGQSIATLAISEGVGPAIPKRIATRFSGGKLSGEKWPVPDAAVADWAIVLAAAADGAPCLVEVDLTAAGVERETLAGLDPTRPQGRLQFNDVPAEPVGTHGSGWTDLQRILDRAAIMFAFEQIGGAQAALEMAKDYALGRYAFGRQIASYQAIKHRLADMYVAFELGRSNAYYGAWALSTEAPELPVAAAAARVAATEAVELASKENIQIHGGMGFTWEFDCHMYYRRAKSISLAIGSGRVWKEKLIGELENRNAA